MFSNKIIGFLAILIVVLMALLVWAATSGNPEILMAAAEGNLTKVKAILAANPDQISASDKDGWTALHYAANAGQSPMVEFLLSKGADVNSKTHEKQSLFKPERESGWTVLHMAANVGNDKLVKLLLAKGADVNARTSNSHTPLHMACIDGHKTTIELLLAGGADVKIMDSKGCTPLKYLIIRKNDDLAEFLRKHGAVE